MGRGVVEHAGGLYQKGGKRREKYKEEIGERTSFTTDTIASPTSSFSICTSFHSVPSPKPMSPVVVVKVDDDSKTTRPSGTFAQYALVLHGHFSSLSPTLSPSTSATVSAATSHCRTIVHETHNSKLRSTACLRLFHFFPSSRSPSITHLTIASLSLRAIKNGERVIFMMYSSLSLLMRWY